MSDTNEQDKKNGHDELEARLKAMEKRLGMPEKQPTPEEQMRARKRH